MKRDDRSSKGRRERAPSEAERALFRAAVSGAKPLDGERAKPEPTARPGTAPGSTDKGDPGRAQRVAERAGASDHMVTAALFHEIGHHILDDEGAAARGHDLVHEECGAEALTRIFGPERSTMTPTGRPASSAAARTAAIAAL